MSSVAGSKGSLYLCGILFENESSGWMFRSTGEVVARAVASLDPRSESPIKPDSDAVEPNEDAKCIPSPSSSTYGKILCVKVLPLVCHSMP